ncbi:M23 family metallopeptidase [Pseudarthrobacter sp. J64]|uniref:murein hydrolase activator EnvC family protein n=1 Tax=Pseudarthrobacter sp. J64 TaxID=3116485 RepID=UPI002E80FC71|nr:M23 family metallopeptidase [Pseudarthrobacter sp. J64]MEE2569404.1 M23 family metallopeptidase [Pseudarthrobacter sp. J64]
MKAIRRVKSAILLTALLPTTLLLPSALAAAQPAAAGQQQGPAAAATPGTAWEWPLHPRPAVVRSAVLRDFDPPDMPWLSGHRGVDLATTSDAAALTSPAAGTVSFVGTVVDRPVITVDHGGGLKSSFEPVTSGLTVGASVAAGDTLGTVDAGHCGSVPCVHWGVRRNGDYINPLGFFVDLRPSVLLPLSRRASAQTMAEMPVIDRPATSVLTSWVPS